MAQVVQVAQISRDMQGRFTLVFSPFRVDIRVERLNRKLPSSGVVDLQRKLVAP